MPPEQPVQPRAQQERLHLHRQGPGPRQRQVVLHHRLRQQKARRNLGSRPGRQPAPGQRHRQAAAHPPDLSAGVRRRGAG